MTTPDFRTRVTRPSEAEKNQALVVLRDGAVDGRLSHDTFMRRMNIVLTARSRADIDHAMADLRTHGRLSEFIVRTVNRVATLTVRIRRAWHGSRLPGLRLPEPGTEPLSIGRAPLSGLRFDDDSVSRRHAELTYADDHWRLSDLGSRNGTYVNGLRIAGTVRVHPGDHVAFGNLHFRLSV
ncbi:FHA domain-containing protein [Streptomyces sp. NPDC001407]|uniref:FHA domain-containing protein n=1 Tax=unclassified Streptomyces TaxID=2593676 RepID=UPI0036B04988